MKQFNFFKHLHEKLKANRRHFTVVFKGQSFKAIENETLLNSALKQNIEMAYSCGSGVCKQCRLFVLTGAVNNTDSDKSVTLGCKTYPLSNLEITQI